MSIIFTIGGQDFSNNVDLPSVQITEGLPSHSDTMSFNVTLRSAEITTTGPFTPQSSQVVVLTVNGIKEFEGIIATVQTLSRGSLSAFTFACTATDYTKFLDRRLVAKSTIPAGYAGDIATLLVQTYAPEFNAQGIQRGFTVPEQTFDYEPLSSALDKLAQGIGYNWYVDFNKTIHFYSGLDESAPLPVIDIDSTLTIGNVVHTEDTSRLKNKIYIKDATVRSSESRTDSYVADGRQGFFPLFAPPYSHEDISVTVNGGAVSIKPDPLTHTAGDIAGGEGFCFSCIINQGIRFGEDNIPPTGSLVDITYNPTQQGEFVDIVEDLDSIRMMSARENSSGVYEHVISLPDYRVADLSPLHAVALLLLDRLAWPIVSGTFETMQIQGWHAGQTFILQSAKRSLIDTKSQWKLGISAPPVMYIQTVTKRIDTTDRPTVGYHQMRNTVQYSNLVNEAAF